MKASQKAKEIYERKGGLTKESKNYVARRIEQSETVGTAIYWEEVMQDLDRIIYLKNRVKHFEKQGFKITN